MNAFEAFCYCCAAHPHSILTSDVSVESKIVVLPVGRRKPQWPHVGSCGIRKKRSPFLASFIAVLAQTAHSVKFPSWQHLTGWLFSVSPLHVLPCKSINVMYVIIVTSVVLLYTLAHKTFLTGTPCWDVTYISTCLGLVLMMWVRMWQVWSCHGNNTTQLLRRYSVQCNDHAACDSNNNHLYTAYRCTSAWLLARHRFAALGQANLMKCHLFLGSHCFMLNG